eukprot:TRINITY_DN9706_c1_g3_i1.p1 TRINITY_DN9706_c1_g3~~TRINITY_DN9706_c1_g3_i1.p1  ORF type:complete len:872 (-),score=177.34 TRINITY_DN9706_c1_g3_i1:605-3220(-)
MALVFHGSSRSNSRRHWRRLRSLCKAALLACSLLLVYHQCFLEELVLFTAVSGIALDGRKKSENLARWRDLNTGLHAGLHAAAVDTFDPWTILGISTMASKDEARKAYKRLIAKYHPDVDDSPEAEAMFQQIVRAHAVVTGEDRTLDDATLLNNAVKNLRNDVEFMRAQKHGNETKLREVEAQLAETQIQLDQVSTEVGVLGGAALGLLGGPAFAILGAMIGLAVSKNEDAMGELVRGTGKLAKGMVDAVGRAAGITEARSVAYTSRPFISGQRAILVGPPDMAGKHVTIEAVLGKTCSVRFDTGIIASVATKNIRSAAQYSLAEAAATAASEASAADAAPDGPAPAAASQVDDDKLKFNIGQRVIILNPPAMAGRRGKILRPTPGERFEVQFDSGARHNIATENIQDAAALEPKTLLPVVAPEVAEQDADEPEFMPGQRVVLLGPPAMAGRQGTVIGPAPGQRFEVLFDSGSVFQFAKDIIRDATVAAATTEDDSDEVEFTAGQRVTLVGPPAMAGKQGIVLGRASGDSFAVGFELGSVLSTASQNMLSASPPGPEIASAAASKVDALQFTPGQRVKLLSPPAMAGKRATILRSVPGQRFEVQFDSGSVLKVPVASLSDAAASAGHATSSAAAPKTTQSMVSGFISRFTKQTSEDDQKARFEPGQQVVMLAPPKMRGERGTIVGLASDETYSVRFDSGSEFRILTEYLQDAVDFGNEQLQDQQGELSVTPGEQVTILGPRKMNGKRGTIVGSVSGDTLSVRFKSGSVFQILMRDVAPAAVPLPAVVPSATSLSVVDAGERCFVPGQEVVVMGPPKMAGKKGTIAGLAWGNTLPVRFESGGVFQILKDNIRDASAPDSAASGARAVHERVV